MVSEPEVWTPGVSRCLKKRQKCSPRYGHPTSVAVGKRHKNVAQGMDTRRQSLSEKETKNVAQGMDTRHPSLSEKETKNVARGMDPSSVAVLKSGRNVARGMDTTGQPLSENESEIISEIVTEMWVQTR